MRYLLFLTSALCTLSFAQATISTESFDTNYQVYGQKSLYVKEKNHDSDDTAFASFATKETQILGEVECTGLLKKAYPSTQTAISFEREISDENIDVSHNNTIFTIRKSGFYKVNYGITLGSGSGVFSLHNKGSIISGSEIEILILRTMVSQAVIVYLHEGSEISLSLDTFNTMGPVEVAAILPNANGAYIDFVKLD